MGIFSRRESNEQSKLDKMIESLKKIVVRDGKYAAIFFYKSPDGGSSFIQGDAQDIHRMLSATAKQDSAFASVLKMVAREISTNDMHPNIPQQLKDVIDGKKKTGLVDLPGGHKGIALDPNNINGLSDDDVDDILDNLLGGPNPRSK